MVSRSQYVVQFENPSYQVRIYYVCFSPSVLFLFFLSADVFCVVVLSRTRFVCWHFTLLDPLICGWLRLCLFCCLTVCDHIHTLYLFRISNHTTDSEQIEDVVGWVEIPVIREDHTHI